MKIAISPRIPPTMMIDGYDDESSSDNDADDHDDDDSEAADAGDSAEKTRKKEERKSTLVGECCSRREDCYENQNQNLWRKKSRRRTAGSRSVVLFLRVGVGSLRLQCKKFEIEKYTVQLQRPLRWSSIGAREGHYLLCSLLLEPWIKKARALPDALPVSLCAW